MRNLLLRVYRLVPATFLLLIPLPAGSQAPDVDEIVELFVEAIGGRDNISAIGNFVYENGTYEEGDYRSNGDSTMSLARPWFKLVGDKQDPGGYQ